MKEYPKNFARFYDLIYHRIRDEADLEFFQNEAIRIKGKVLEIGVGTGRLFMNSLNHGVDIYGIDISDPMLNVLYDKLDRNEHYRVSLQDMTDFRFDFKFDLIVAPFRVIMHIPDKSDQLKAINNVYKHLNKNGKFIFDTFIPDLKSLINGLKDITDFQGEYEPGKMVRRIVSTTPDLLNQIIDVRFIMEWEENGKLEREDWSTPMRYFFRFELEHLVERSKFGKCKILGDYKGNELNKDSKEFIVVCQR
ncbi:MAG: class I SAM-dependent methyltransferase [Bacteroidales bacterium]|jgi:SAM-dependent methyltransferase|nr:class I SAM-dependent methyltransferase [Bacteroidales bacterium]